MDYDKYFQEFEANAKASGDVAPYDDYYWHGLSDFVEFLKEQQNSDVTTWTCFHCGFSTRNEQFAAAHFGVRDEPALCRSWAELNADNRLQEYQEITARLAAQCAENARQRIQIEGLEYQVDGRHAEIVSYKPFRECQSIQDIFNVYDSMEGRALTAEAMLRGEYIGQLDFDATVGQLDRVLSKLVNWGRSVKTEGFTIVDKPNAQTLKHHAEDMIAAGQKMLRDLGHEVESTPQPE